VTREFTVPSVHGARVGKDGRVNYFDRTIAGVERRLQKIRDRSSGFDHFARAVGRYTDLLGGRLAAAIAYYGFFAVFALGLVAYSVAGAVLTDSEQIHSAFAGFLERNLPFLHADQIRQASGRPGVIGLILLMITGIGWVEAIRSSQRQIHGLNQQPGYIVLRQLIDLAVLIGVFLLLGLSAGAVDALGALLRRFFGAGSVGSSITGWVLAIAINIVLASALLVAVPRLRVSLRRLLVPVLVVAVGITLLNSVGRFYVIRWERNPAYAVVAGAVGLLVYLYLFNQLLIFGAALLATSTHGRVIDLTVRGAEQDGAAPGGGPGVGPPRSEPPPEAPPPPAAR
jgi:membrane protein